MARVCSGFDGELLVAYSLWTESDQRRGLFKLRLIAIATSARGRGGAVARECLEETLTRIESTLEPGVAGLVYGLVDVNNGASQRLLKHFIFQTEPNAPVEHRTRDAGHADRRPIRQQLETSKERPAGSTSGGAEGVTWRLEGGVVGGRRDRPSGLRGCR